MGFIIGVLTVALGLVICKYGWFCVTQGWKVLFGRLHWDEESRKWIE